MDLILKNYEPTTSLSSPELPRNTPLNKLLRNKFKEGSMVLIHTGAC